MKDYNPEYDDEAGMADNNLGTLKKAVEGIDSLISPGDNLPEWCQEKIAVATSMLVTIWNYMQGEEEPGISETKRSHKRPKYSLKPKGSTLEPIKTATTFEVPKPKKKKKGSYFEHLEASLSEAINENRDMKNWDQTPGRIMPAAESSGGVKVRREQDEWVVSIKGTMLRIPVEEAPSPEDAVAQAKQNLKSSRKPKFAEEFNTSIYAPKAVALGKKFCDFYGITDDNLMQYVTEIIHIEMEEAEKTGKPFDVNKVKSTISKGLRYINGRSEYPMKKKFKSNESKGWTHDTLAARLFEQDLTYEDELNRKLKGKLGK